MPGSEYYDRESKCYFCGEELLYGGYCGCSGYKEHKRVQEIRDKKISLVKSTLDNYSNLELDQLYEVLKERKKK